MKLLKVRRTNNSVLKAFEHDVKQGNEDVVAAGHNKIEALGVCCRSDPIELAIVLVLELISAITGTFEGPDAQLPPLPCQRPL